MLTLTGASLSLVGRQKGAGVTTRNGRDGLVEAVPIPPTDITIQNPNAERCTLVPTKCIVGIDTPCLGCYEFGFICTHVADDLTIEQADGSVVVVERNDTPSEGYCLPPSNLNNVINPYTTKVFLSFNDEQQVWNYRTGCKYPTIFSAINTRSDCNVYNNPCQGGKLANGTQVWDTTTAIDFDPFLNGRCIVDDGEYRIAEWDEALGPRTITSTIGTNVIAATSCPANTLLTDNYDAMISAGVSQQVAAQLVLNTPVCIPAPCKYDVTTDKFCSTNVYDSTFKCCVCDFDSGFLPVFEDFSGDGNYVESGTNSPNACKYIGDFREFESSAYTYADGSPLSFLNTLTDSYQYVSRQNRHPALINKSLTVGSALGSSDIIGPLMNVKNCFSFTGQEKLPDTSGHVQEGKVGDDVQRMLSERMFCKDANSRILFNPILANGLIEQAHQYQERALSEHFSMAPIRTNLFSMRKLSSASWQQTNPRTPGVQQQGARICDPVPWGPSPCAEYTEMKYNWSIRHNMNISVPTTPSGGDIKQITNREDTTNANPGKDYTTPF